MGEIRIAGKAVDPIAAVVSAIVSKYGYGRCVSLLGFPPTWITELTEIRNLKRKLK